VFRAPYLGVGQVQHIDVAVKVQQRQNALNGIGFQRSLLVDRLGLKTSATP
jgi:hypothetical protein